MMTEAEEAVLALTAELWNAFLLLPEQRKDDCVEFRHKLHDLQRMVMVRPVRRNMDENRIS